jgi:hypothetical protein
MDRPPDAKRTDPTRTCAENTQRRFPAETWVLYGLSIAACAAGVAERYYGTRRQARPDDER